VVGVVFWKIGCTCCLKTIVQLIWVNIARQSNEVHFFWYTVSVLEYMVKQEEVNCFHKVYSKTGVRLKRSIKSINWFICSTSYLLKTFMLSITMQLDISVKLIPQAWRPCYWLCVCLVVFELSIHSLRWSKVNWILILLKNMSFLKSVKFQPVEISIQPIVWHLVAFKMSLKSLALFWLCCQTDSTGCFENSTGCFSKILNRILLGCSNLS